MNREEQNANVTPGTVFGLRILGVPVRFVRYPREKHGIEERAHQVDLMQRIVDWFDQYLKGSPSL